MESIVSPGNRGSFISDSYRGTDHPEYETYLRNEHGKIVPVMTGEIMQQWVDAPILSEGFQTCYPVIALDKNMGQMIHVSMDPWRYTDPTDYLQKIKDWQNMGCDEIVLMHSKNTVLPSSEVDRLNQMFGNKLLHIDLKTDLTFGFIVDVKKRLLLVELNRAKELRKYNI